MEMKQKIYYSKSFILRIVFQLFVDLKNYYLNPYPFLLIIGAFRRIRRRLKVLWLPKGRGRPKVSDEIVDLIVEMKRRNPLWGALRISQELKLLGVSIHKKTVQRILKEFGFLPPKLNFHPPPWSWIFSSQVDAWAMDFTCVFDRFGRQLFILVIINTLTKELVLVNVSCTPDRRWIIQQFRNTAISDTKFPSHLIIDNDGIYGKWIDRVLKADFDIDVIRIPKGQPWCNGVCERFHLTLKEEILNRITINDLSHAQQLCFEYQIFYNRYRPHQSLSGKPPCNDQATTLPFDSKRVRKIKEVSGLITRFELAA